MRILVLRHGRTSLNDKGYFNGQYDEPLNDQGRSEAATAREKLATEKINRIFCSPLSRTRETCEIATAGRGIPVTFDDRLMERSMGTLDGRDVGMSGFEHGRMFDYDYDPDLPGGFETWEDVFTRVAALLDEILAEFGASDDAILLVTHAGTARAIYYYFFPLPADRNILQPKMHNCEIAEYRIIPKASGELKVDYLSPAERT